jgi:hypothetical protein
MIEAFLLAITNGAIGEKRRVTFAARIDDCVLTRNVKIGFLLTRETGFRQIFRRGAAAHCNINCVLFVAFAKIAIRLANLLLDWLWKFGF